MNKEQVVYQWVKASDELPDKGIEVTIRSIADKRCWNSSNMFFNTVKYHLEFYEWLKPITAVVMSVEEWGKVEKLISGCKILANPEKDFDKGWDKMKEALSQLNKIL